MRESVHKKLFRRYADVWRLAYTSNLLVVNISDYVTGMLVFIPLSTRNSTFLYIDSIFVKEFLKHLISVVYNHKFSESMFIIYLKINLKQAADFLT